MPFIVSMTFPRASYNLPSWKLPFLKVPLKRTWGIVIYDVSKIWVSLTHLYASG